MVYNKKLYPPCYGQDLSDGGMERNKISDIRPPKISNPPKKTYIRYHTPKKSNIPKNNQISDTLKNQISDIQVLVWYDMYSRRIFVLKLIFWLYWVD